MTTHSSSDQSVVRASFPVDTSSVDTYWDVTKHYLDLLGKNNGFWSISSLFSNWVSSSKGQGTIINKKLDPEKVPRCPSLLHIQTCSSNDTLNLCIHVLCINMQMPIAWQQHLDRWHLLVLAIYLLRSTTDWLWIKWRIVSHFWNIQDGLLGLS